MKKYAVLIISVIVLSISVIGCSKDEGIGENGISKEEFDQIKIGMSWWEVGDIVGSHGEKISEKKSENSSFDSVKTEVWKFQGETKGTATITFDGQKVTEKEQDGLE